jgi:Ca-activated chloride channel family protein
MIRALLLALCIAAPANACDLALVLVHDTSSSLDDAELTQMREGVASALTDPRLAGSFAAANVQVAVVNYADHPELAVDWFQATPDALAGAAERIRNMPRVSGLTATGLAVQFALAQLERTDCASRVIDIATDGENNAGPPPSTITAELDPFAVQINGLVIGDDADRFEATTQFGASAFTIGVASYDDFGRAMLRKISLEVSMALTGRTEG